MGAAGEVGGRCASTAAADVPPSSAIDEARSRSSVVRPAVRGGFASDFLALAIDCGAFMTRPLLGALSLLHALAVLAATALAALVASAGLFATRFALHVVLHFGI
jgi:hypothetical protein